MPSDVFFLIDRNSCFQPILSSDYPGADIFRRGWTTARDRRLSQSAKGGEDFAKKSARSSVAQKSHVVVFVHCARELR